MSNISVFDHLCWVNMFVSYILDLTFDVEANEKIKIHIRITNKSKSIHKISFLGLNVV